MTDIKEYRIKRGWTQTKLAERLGVTKSMISQVGNGVLPVPLLWESKLKLSDDLYNKELPEIKESEPSRKIPVAGDVYATISEAMQDVVAYGPQTFVNIPIFSQGEFALQASGHSMKGYINQGDWIVVKRITNRDAIIYGECYVVVTKGDNLKTVKFIKEHKDLKKLWLVPYNIEQFEPQSLLKDDIIEIYSVVGLFRKV